MRRFIRENQGRSDQSLLDLSDLDLCKALGAVQANGEVSGVNRVGLLLFGRESALRNFLPTHEVAWQVLEGTAVHENVFLRWPLLRTVEELEARFRARNHSVEIVDLFRTEIPDFSANGFREALCNALVHRDYAALGAVHVHWLGDAIRLDNPGSFPEGVRLDNLLVTPPRPRNPVLADVFKRAGLVERSGRGIDTIFVEQLRYGRPAPDYSQSTANSVTVILPGGPANLKFAAFVAAQGRKGHPLWLWDLLVINEVSQQRWPAHFGPCAALTPGRGQRSCPCQSVGRGGTA